jgi:hypothetical protein
MLREAKRQKEGFGCWGPPLVFADLPAAATSNALNVSAASSMALSAAKSRSTNSGAGNHRSDVFELVL